MTVKPSGFVCITFKLTRLFTQMAGGVQSCGRHVRHAQLHWSSATLLITLALFNLLLLVAALQDVLAAGTCSMLLLMLLT
jgi:hypothetical protein